MALEDSYIDATERFLVRNYRRSRFVAKGAKGMWIYDINGRPFMDCVSTYGADFCGNNHPGLNSLIINYLQNNGIVTMPGGFYNVPLSHLVEPLAEFCGMDKVMFKSGGSEAVEAAIKLAKRWGHQIKGIPDDEPVGIIAAVDCFHGRMPTAIAMSTVAQYRKGFGPFPPEVRHIDFGNPNALARAINDRTGVFIVEPIQGEGGVVVPPDGYLRECEKICHSNNVLLVVDEIQSGFGRTGCDFAYQREGVKPDILIIAKALGGGVLPFSAVLASRSIMDLIGPGDEGSTFGSHPFACMIAREVIAIIKEEKLTENAREMGEYAKSEFGKIDSPLIKEVRGRGLMMGIQLIPGTKGAAYFCDKLLEEGFIFQTAGHNDDILRFSPPLIITSEQIDWVAKALRKVLQP